MSSSSAFVQALLSASLQTAWPAACAACDHPIPDEAVFCAACQLSLNPLVGVCPGCALPMPDRSFATDRAARCRTCRRVPMPFAAATAGFEYGEALAEALVRMKHGGRRHLARRLARLLIAPLAEAIDQAALRPGDAVVPVPLHPRKLRTRGFNQSSELARWALRGLGRIRRVRPRLERHLLLRTRETRELGHAGPAARLAEVTGAFGVRDPTRLRGRRVLLVDDVYTTGATFHECTRALLHAGATAVHTLALARAV